MFKRIFFSAVSIVMLAVAGCKSDDPANPGGGDPGPPARVMAVHASPGGPAIDVYLDTTRTQSGLSYGNNTGYVNVAPGVHTLKATVAGTQTVILTTPPFLVLGNIMLTVFAADTGASITVPYFFDTLSTASTGKARLRFIHMAVRGPNLDVVDSVNATNMTIISEQTAYLAGTRFNEINAGVHNFLVVRPTGPTHILMARLTATLAEGKNYTLWAKGLPGVSGSLGVSAGLIAHN